MPEPLFSYGDTEKEYLKSRDKKMRAAIERLGHIERATTPDLFEALCSSIVSQQVSNAAAATVWRRFCGLGAVAPQAVDALDAQAIQRCGMSMRKAQYIKSAARAVASGELDLAGLETLPDDAVIQKLTALPGIGVWTAEMLMLFSLQRPDIMSYGDYGIRKGLMRLQGHKEMPKERFERYRRRYAPYGSVASLYLWALAAEDDA